MFKAVHRIIEYMGKDKKRIYIGVVFSLLESIMAIVPLGIAATMLYAIYQDANGTAALSRTAPWRALGIIVAAVVLRVIFHYIKSILQDNAAYNMSEAQRLTIGEKLKRVALGFFTKTKTGTINAVMTTELSFYEMCAMNVVDTIFNSYIFLVLMILGFFCIAPVLGCIVLGSLLLSLLGLTTMTHVSNQNAPSRQGCIEDLTDACIEYIRGMAVVKSYNQQGVSSGKYIDACERSRALNIKYEKVYSVCNLLYKLGLYVGIVGVLYGAAMLAMRGSISMELWMMLSLYSFMMFVRVEAWDTATVLSAILNTTMDHIEEMTDMPYMDIDGNDITVENYAIKFEDVQFSYGKRTVINGVNLDIPQNSTLAIVGPSGGGKTTLCNLLARFYDVDAGSISIGGHDIRAFQMDSLLSHITMVFQKVYLFQDTIENNIRFGKPDATREEVIAIAKKARCHEFITQLDHGYDTVIGEGGGTLSGGEKQRISIARAMLKNADIVILDEATANIDPENEFYIQEAIAELVKGKTVIIIAHKLATIQHADKIIVVEDGQITQEGKHTDLIAQEGTYRSFWQQREQAAEWAI